MTTHAASAVATTQVPKQTVLNEVESKNFCAAAGLPVVETRLAQSAAQAVAQAKEIGFPVAMKIISPDIIHKSDGGGVKLNLANGNQVRRAYTEIMAATQNSHQGARIKGVSMQKMAPPGLEVVVGLTTDAQFGPMLMFGLGGVMVEVLKDVAFRLIPLTPHDAGEMIEEIKGYKLLSGFRGAPALDVERLKRLLLKISDTISAHPEIREMDLNPVMVYQSGVLVVDARIIREEYS